MHALSRTSQPVAARGRALRTWLALGAGVCALLFAPSGESRTLGDPAFTCPSPPSGWKAGTGPIFWGPDENPGTDQVEITCQYQDRGGKSFGVRVSYALPTDFNPYSDFYYGCGTTGAVSWSGTQRMFRATSNQRWVMASFSDPGNLLSGGEEPRFESLARVMVSDALPLAHACSFQPSANEALAGWLFDFTFELASKGVVVRGGIGTHVSQKIAGEASYAIPDGSFQTKGAAGHPAVTVINAPKVAIVVAEAKQRHTLTVELTKGLSFLFATTKTRGSSAALVAGIRVIHSTLPGCGVGSLGTLSLATTPAAVKLQLCASVLGTLRNRNSRVDITRS
jgi:hypothetical protein